jgi:hypothetical protein
MIERFPHCDQRILHTPGECQYCDMYPHWQQLREAWGIAFTGHIPDPESDMMLCPADYVRGTESYDLWGGNRAVPE